MLTKRIIPCLDIKDGRVVKGVNFVHLKDAGDPVENAKFYDEQGADELVFLDITASHERRKTTVQLVKKVADTIFLPFTVGGGVRAIDAKCAVKTRSKQEWQVFINGGRTPTGIDAIGWAKKMASFGAGEILLTSMDYDGTKEGYDIELTRRISESVRIPVIASGGAGTLAHLYEALTDGKADAVLAASIFHYREYSVGQAKAYLAKKGVAVRI